MEEYKIAPQTRIGHVHLKVADLNRALEFYHGLPGFDIVTLYGDQAAFISASGYHLRSWQGPEKTAANLAGTG